MSGSEVSLGVVSGPSVGRTLFGFFNAPDGCWCGAVGGDSLGESVGRGGGAGTGQ